VKDFARVAQLSAEEAFRLLTHKHNHEYHAAWSRFETEHAKRTAEIRERHSVSFWTDPRWAEERTAMIRWLTQTLLLNALLVP
jgi:hypothetical protein